MEKMLANKKAPITKECRREMYTESDLVRIAKRENNKKRNYLVVNPLQGKHIPVSPGRALQVFSELAGLLEIYKTGEKLLVVGFAETATAIGVQLALDLRADYIQTTREEIPGAEYLFFSEEHSHATEQRLVKDGMDKVMGRVDRIIFAEDEVTTGKTIWNLINVLEQHYGGKTKFAVASLLNGMSEEAVAAFADRGIGLHYLVKINHEGYPEIADGIVDNGIYHQEDISRADYTGRLDVDGWMNTRRLVNAGQYEEACRRLCGEVMGKLPLDGCTNILLLGTEEFMFPGLYLGKCLEKRGHSVRFHATTRSPIAVSSDADYPLHERYALPSLYEDGRKTFVYDIGSYDAVVVLTDARMCGQEGRRGEMALLNAVRSVAGGLQGNRNEKVYLVRWQK